MKSTKCKNWFSGDVSADMGEALAIPLTTHEIQEHGASECKEARLELCALILHIMKIEPSEVPLVKERLVEHIKGCTCGEGREKHK